MLNKNFSDASKDSDDDSSKVYLFSFKSAFNIFFLIFFNNNRFFMIKHVKNYKKNVKNLFNAIKKLFYEFLINFRVFFL